MEIAKHDVWTAPEARRSRRWWKTFLVSMLLCLIPVVGWSMATHYVMTHERPEEYAPGRAASAGGMLLLFSIVTYVVVIVAISVVMNA